MQLEVIIWLKKTHYANMKLIILEFPGVFPDILKEKETKTFSIKIKKRKKWL